MNLSESHLSTIEDLLLVEHKAIAQRLGFNSFNSNTIDRNLLIRSIGMLDELSRKNNDRAHRIVVTAAAILWTYRDQTWENLRDYLILILSRIGFAPSAIMVDEDYNYESSQFAGLNSIINKLNVTVHQLDHEIFVQGKKFLVTNFQKKVWNKLSKLKLLGISAPTSAGKTFIIQPKNPK